MEEFSTKTSKPNPIKHWKVICNDQVESIPGIKEFFNVCKSINVIYQINKLNKNHMIFQYSPDISSLPQISAHTLHFEWGPSLTLSDREATHMPAWYLLTLLKKKKIYLSIYLYMIISVDAEKAFDKIQHPFIYLAIPGLSYSTQDLELQPSNSLVAACGI